MNFDMETTMQINNLARELLKSGAASSSADAHIKAEKIILAESPKLRQVAEQRQSTAQSSSQASQQSVPIEIRPQMPRGEYEKLSNYDERILRELSMIKMKIDELQKSVAGLSSLSKDMDALKQYVASAMAAAKAEKVEVNRMAQPEQPRAQPQQYAPSSQQPEMQVQQQSFQAQRAAPSPPSPSAEKKSMHPRCGGYSSEDVDVSKIFYSGSK